MIKKFIAIYLIALSYSAFSQNSISENYKKQPLSELQLQRWSHLDLEKDSIPGMSVDKVYSELIKDKKGSKVIVAVIDSGVDIDHPDLKSTIWTNKNEKVNNKKDDDKNGYVDDIHGWNFLGEANNENLELVRMLKKPNDGSEEYKLTLAEYEKKYNKVFPLKETVDLFLNADKNVREALKKEDYTSEELNNMPSVKYELFQSKRIMQSFIEQSEG